MQPQVLLQLIRLAHTSPVRIKRAAIDTASGIGIKICDNQCNMTEENERYNLKQSAGLKHHRELIYLSRRGSSDWSDRHDGSIDIMTDKSGHVIAVFGDIDFLEKGWIRSTGRNIPELNYYLNMLMGMRFSEGVHENAGIRRVLGNQEVFLN